MEFYDDYPNLSAAGGGGGGAQAVGVSAKASTTNGTATTGGVTTQATGSTFIIGVACAAANTINTPTDSKSNAYTAVGSVQTQTGGAALNRMHVFRCENGTGGAGHTVTGTIGAAQEITVLFLEIKNSAVASFDAGSLAAGEDISATPWSITSGGFAQANNIVVAALGTDSGSNPATYAEDVGAPLGFIIQQQETNGAVNWTMGLGTLPITATGAISPSFTALGGISMLLKIFGIKA